MRAGLRPRPADPLCCCARALGLWFLVETGLAAKQPNPHDARGTVVTLTDAGRQELVDRRTAFGATVLEHLVTAGHTEAELATAVAVLRDLLEVWKQDALCFERFEDPRVVLTSYIRAKMGHSRSRPLGSKVWAEEILHGAPLLGASLDDDLVPWALMKEAKIRRWVEEKRILPVEPSALLYMIWAATQHYADFGYQVTLLNGGEPLSDPAFERAVQTVTCVILRGIGLEP